jgi:hypothetical protein
MSVGDAIRRSKDLFKRTWGENVSAQIGFSLLSFLAILPAIVIVAIGVNAGGAIAGITILVAVVWIVGVVAAIAAMSVIFQTALYHYAVDGHVPAGYFTDADMRAAFAPRQRRTF